MIDDNFAIQLDFFEEHTPYSLFGEELKQSKDALRRTQKRFFAQNNDLAKEIIKLREEVEIIRSMMIKRIK